LIQNSIAPIIFSIFRDLPAVAEFLTGVASFLFIDGIDFLDYFVGETVGGIVKFFIVSVSGNGVVNVMVDIFSSVEEKLSLMSLKTRYDDCVELLNL
jgi:hypothetical protein